VPSAAEKDTRSVLSRLFGKKKPRLADNTRVEVQEELSIQIDTLSVAQQDSAFLEVGKLIKSLQADQHLQNRKVVERELELINTNTVLSSQLLSILQEVEKEELQQIRKNNQEASVVVNTGIKRMSGVMIIFLLGTAVLVFLILTDVAKSNYYRQQLIRSKEEAEALSQVKQRFLANMSHEIRTPLQSIIGFAEQLKDSGSNSEALAAIHSSSDHLLHIVNEVLDYSRIESGKFKLIHEPFNLGDLLQEVSSGMRIQAENRQLEFSVKTAGNSNVNVLGDAFRLRQILYNLLGNAIKFTKKGFVEFNVTIEEISSALSCRFSIVDSGIGIKSEEISRVFQQFEQADDKTSTHYGGSGLGLTIVKALVDAQHGQLQVDSEVGKGSSFTVLLNFDKAEYENTFNIDSQIVQKTKPNLVRNVLVVDDDPLILRLCTVILQKHGVTYKTFQDSSQVLEHGHDDVDLVLLDIRMPTVSGIDLCKALRSRVNAHTRIVALTAHILPEEHAPLMAAGFDDVLAKPFREKQLVDLLGISSPVMDPAPNAKDASVDFSILRKMTMGDETLFQSVLSQFMEETQADVLALEIKLNHMDVRAVREIVHKLTGRVGQIGAQKLSTELRAIEIDLDKGKSLQELVERIIHSLDGVKELLKKTQEVVV
jgi:signal transduction histidine kinase/FixJ family two-component response regulator